MLYIFLITLTAYPAPSKEASDSDKSDDVLRELLSMSSMLDGTASVKADCDLGSSSLFFNMPVVEGPIISCNGRLYIYIAYNFLYLFCYVLKADLSL